MALPEIIKDIEARIIRPTSTDNAIVRFDGATGQVQNSTSLIDDNGKITAPRMIHSNSVSTDTSLSRIPTETEIAFETGNNNGQQSVWLWRENWTSANYGVFHDNSADVIHVVGGGASKFQINLSNGNTGIHGSLTVDGDVQIEGGSTLTGQLKLKGGTSNTSSIYQFDNATYRNPESHTPEMIINCNNATTGIIGYRPALVLYNPQGNQNATVGMTFAFRETASAGNSVMIGAIVGFKESAGTSGAWSVGGLRFLTKNTGALTEAMTITGAGNVGIGTTAPTYKLHVNGTGYFDKLFIGDKINLSRSSGTNCGRISYYSDSYVTWFDYMSNVVAGGCPTGGQPSSYGNVTTWALRSLIENISGYGWIWESATNTAAATTTIAPTPMMALSSNNGNLTVRGTITGSAVYGAVWNDYAEYRKADSIESGRVVIEHESGKMKLSTERLQPGAEIISDTFGFAIGETDEYKTPIAASGRVLAYPNEDRYSYPLGCAVCTGPNGTVSQMTREEIREYPERIIGTVSEIPEYETWGTGNVKVDGRIWIRIK